MVYQKYGFVADHTKSTLHNASIMLASMPTWYYFTKPTNSACHNLCTETQPPYNYRALLGLSLKFIPTPRYTNSRSLIEWTDRFRQDLFTKIFMAHTTSQIPRLFIRSDWVPPIRMVNYNLQLRVNNFIKKIHSTFIKKRSRSNMLPYQRKILSELQQSKTHVIINADKNLGPCIIERKQYIMRALNDHLLDNTTYKQLTLPQAKQHIQTIENRLSQFLEYYGRKLDSSDIKYLKKTADVKDHFPKFYVTAKVHKTPWKTRPIVSVCGSILDGMGRWVDKILQPFFNATTSAIRSSTTLKDALLELGPLPPNARFFTADAVSMYTNIDTNHALQVIEKFIRDHPQYTTIHERNAVIEGLNLIMRNNVFQFGNTYWHQQNGTAMGVSPSCMYATLYFATYEQTLIEKYPELKIYKRYIDDVIGIWIPRTTNDEIRWHTYQQEMNNFGRLRWELSQRLVTINFLDLTLNINHQGIISTKLFEKPENLYLYLPAQSAHPFSNLKGLIHGMVYRTIRLTSNKTDQAVELQNIVRQLVARGYNQSFLVKVINQTYCRINNEQQTNRPTDQVVRKANNNVCFFHTYYQTF
jgi:hypothetical protein